MSDLIEQFMKDMQAIAGIPSYLRRLEIQRLIDQYESAIRRSFADSDAHGQIQSLFGEAKEQMFGEISANSPNGIPNTIAEFYQEIFEELSLRLRTIRYIN
jgi:hypothetical protein